MRPAWTCAACGMDWPCPTKRSQLAAEYDRARTSLALVMAGYFVEAAEDLPLRGCGEMYIRFAGGEVRP
ncbi:flavin reductase [Planosporangium flavigriseum]|uniref:Flavin reductase n=2 Tax=Planosporangium flavigriseum TaxID=373681 RepID=A0A8J3PJG7_9ACTN|nr:flavin reductase [Planosporangium flavigriseum]GIG71807.1 hypothetical protein Pfl04_02110 [Planosporangium flavigriseum]